MQCPVCHTEVGAQSGFCGNCGASLSAPAPEAVTPPAAYIPPPATAPASGYPAAAATAESSGLSPNAASAIAYITFIPAILFLVMAPYNKTPIVRFHSFQSIGLNVVWIALWIVVAVCAMVLAFIPFLRILVFLIPLLYFAVGIGFFILWLVTILKASKGEWFKLPLIGDFAMKQAQS
jgi:uncharacterized membrane protein